LIEEGHEFHAASGIWIILCQLVFHVSSKLFVKDLKGFGSGQISNFRIVICVSGEKLVLS
jgi:hypothetical protein